MEERYLRRVTEREVFEELYGSIHDACLERTADKVTKVAKEYNIPIACFDISALTYQTFRVWLDNRSYIKSTQANKEK